MSATVAGTYPDRGTSYTTTTDSTRRASLLAPGVQLGSAVGVLPPFQFAERVDDRGVELGAGVAVELLKRRIDTDAESVCPVGSHRVVGVADRDDA